MNLRDFIDLFCAVCCDCITVQDGPFFENGQIKLGYKNIYFEGVTKEYILKHFADIADRIVSGFNVIGGGAYPVELIIYISCDI